MAIFSVVILTAAPPGLASEAGGSYVKIDGREALLRSVELFLNRDNIKQIQLVIPGDNMEEARRKFGAHLGFSGVKLVTGGPRWVDQLHAASPTVSDSATHVLVHDAARPAVPYSDIDQLLIAAEKHPVVALSTPVRTPLIETDEGGGAVALHSPARFAYLLTPQVFSRAAFVEMAAKKADASPSQLTLIKGSPLNIRIGGPGDASLGKAMLNMMPKAKVRASNPFEEAQW